MDKLVAQFPKQIADALEVASQKDFSFDNKSPFQNVVICGMGGSGIGGSMVTQIFNKEIKVPIISVQNYSLPAFVNEKTLVIGSSYSGNTEETLTTIRSAQTKKATIVGISSGGELIQFCKENKYDFVKIPGGNPPRSMLAFSVIQLINILAKAAIIPPNTLSKATKCRQLLNNELLTIKNQAKELANLLFKKQGVLYADDTTEFVAIRAKQQFNENSKQLCWHHFLPEMNHNELVGWEGGNTNMAVVFFQSQFISKRMRERMQLTKEIIQDKTPHILSINGQGNSLFEESFYFIHIIDWASLYLAELNQENPFEIKSIEYLKRELNKL